jgi:hypothetical protein
VAEGASVVLDASASSDAQQSAASLVYEWDLDGDGLFAETGADAPCGDETGTTPTLSAAGSDGDGTLDVWLRVTDDVGLSDTVVVSVTVTNVDPVVAAGADVD